MFRLTKLWVQWVKLLAVLGLLALVGISCGSGDNQTEITELQDSLAAVENNVDAAQQTADEAKEEIAKLQDSLATIESKVNAIQQPMDTLQEGKHIPLAGGIALFYEDEGEQKSNFYPVDTVFVYDSYDKFEEKWKYEGESSTNEAELIWHPGMEVELAWTTGAEEGTWQLEFFDQTLSFEPLDKLKKYKLTHWHEYVVYTPVGVPTDAGPELSPVMIDWGDQHSIVKQSPWVQPKTISKLGKNNSEGQPYAQILLRDNTHNGDDKYTLVIILGALLESDPPDDLDSAGQRYCYYYCGWYGWNCRLICY